MKKLAIGPWIAGQEDVPDGSEAPVTKQDLQREAGYVERALQGAEYTRDNLRAIRHLRRPEVEKGQAEAEALVERLEEARRALGIPSDEEPGHEEGE